MRPYNDNYSGGLNWATGGNNTANAYDNLDLGFLSLPISYAGLRITPWFMAGGMGQNTLIFQHGESNVIAGPLQTNPNQHKLLAAFQIRDGILPAAFSSQSNYPLSNNYTTLLWGELPALFKAILHGILLLMLVMVLL